MMWWSSVAMSSFSSLFLFYYVFSKLRLYGFTRVLVCVCVFQSEGPRSNRPSLLLTWVDLICTLALTFSIQQTWIVMLVHLYASMFQSWGGR